MSQPGSGPPDTGMERFWDAAAKEHAAFYVESRLDYRAPDMDAFWAIGEEVLDGYASLLGVAVGPEDHVLEIGCGIGRIARALSRRARVVTALDISAEMLARAQEANAGIGNIRWVHGDGVSLAGVEPCQAVLSHVVFQHIPDPAITYGYVREIGTVLEPGGWAAFQVSNDPSVHRPAKPGLRARLGRAPRGTADAAWVGSAVDLDDLRAAARDGGMEVEQVVGEGTQYCIVGTRKPSA